MRPPSGIVTFLTDFGTRDPYVGLMKGMAKREFPRVDCVDLCHEVPAHDVVVGAFFAQAAVGRFPPGTVHVCVVDPGVGTERRGLAVFAHDCYWIGPDNGLLAPIVNSDPESVVRVLASCDALGLPEPSATFHGRDVFAPCAGRLSSGRFGFPTLGKRLPDGESAMVTLDGAPSPDAPAVIWVDHFGNLITSIHAEALSQVGGSEIEVDGRKIPIVSTYADAAEDGELVALVSSYGLLEVAARNARAGEILGVKSGHPVQLVHNPGA